MDISFEWNERKNRSNTEKHGVSFEEAKSVFSDECALMIDDPDHDDGQERFILLGFSKVAWLLVVSHCYRTDEQIIRLISARKATKHESNNYRRWQYA